jgi:uncharacterized protein YpuA (DUF1002 family)
VRPVVQIALALLLCSVLVYASQSAPLSNAMSDQTKVITLGADLEPDQRVAMLRVFGYTTAEATQAGIPILTVTNEEERALLSSSLPESSIGSYAISSAFVEQLPPGSGISVERYNITYITDLMYGNALATAGVRDARVMIAAPIAVSGTAALTGILKAFEKATGAELSPGAKTTAGQELVTTSQLGEELGNKEQAAQLVARIKEQVVETQTDSPTAVRDIVIGVAGDLNVRLSDEQVDQITDVAMKVKALGIQTNDLRTQIRNISEHVSKLDPEKESRSLLQRIIDFIARLFSQFISTLVGWVSPKQQQAGI